MNTAHALACRDGHRRAQERRAEDALTSEQIDALVLDAALAGCDADEIRSRLREARALVQEGLTLDGRGRLQWAI